REQPGEQAGDGVAQFSGAIDPGVLEAENIVCGAWEQLLLKRRDHMESALEAAFVHCDTAYQYLAAAGRPRPRNHEAGRPHGTGGRSLRNRATRAVRTPMARWGDPARPIPHIEA